MKCAKRLAGISESIVFSVVLMGAAVASSVEARASFMDSSADGLAAVLADRMACPKSPKDRQFMMNGETMYWHLKESLRNDFKEVCRATLAASEDLVGTSGTSVSSRVKALEARFLEGFINRFEARSARKANESISDYAKSLAKSVAEIREQARRSAKKGESCLDIRNSALENAIREVYTPVLRATTENRNRIDSSNDCKTVYSEGWDPWHVGRYSAGGSVPGIAKINRAVKPLSVASGSSEPVEQSSPTEPEEQLVTVPAAPLVFAPAPAPVVNVESGNGFQSVSGEGIAKLVADRLACPVKPDSAGRVSNESMFWYTRESLRNDFIENCNVKLSDAEELQSSGKEKKSVTDELRKEIEGHFLNRFTLRSGLKPGSDLKTYAKRFADAVVDVRVHARRMARKGYACQRDEDETVTAIASRLVSETNAVMAFTQSNSSAANDCEEFKKEEWKPWKDQKYSSEGEVLSIARTRHDTNTPAPVQAPEPAPVQKPEPVVVQKPEPKPEPKPAPVVAPKPAPVVVQQPKPAPVTVPAEPIVLVDPKADSDASVPANFLKNSGIGLAYLLADRMACPKRPNDEAMMDAGTQFWYAQKSLIHDFSETCKASLGGGADLVKKNGAVNEAIAAQLRAQIKQEFLRRYEARSGLVPVSTIDNLADTLASAIVKIRIDAREDKNAGRTCSEAGSGEAQKLASGISTSFMNAAKSHVSLKTSNADCASFRDAEWSPWEDSAYESVKDKKGLTHVGIVTSLPGIKNLQRQGVEVKDNVAQSSTSSRQYDTDTALSAFNSASYPEEKYDGDVLFSSAEYNNGLMPGVPYVPTSIGQAKSKDFDACGNIIVVTHRTLRDTFMPGPTHFTIGREGEIMQHGPIQHGMPGSKGHNGCAIHVAFSGGATGADSYKAITTAQIESGAAVLAFVSERIEKLYSIQIQLSHGATRAGALFATAGEAYSRSVVVQNNELSVDGESAHAKDHVERDQMDQVLARARAKFALLNGSKKAILDAQTVAKSVVAVQSGINAGWQRQMHTPHPLGRYVLGAGEVSSAEEDEQSSEDDVANSSGAFANPYVILGL